MFDQKSYVCRFLTALFLVVAAAAPASAAYPHRVPAVIGSRILIRAHEVVTRDQFPQVRPNVSILGKVTSLPGGFGSVLAITYAPDLHMFYVLATGSTEELLFQMTPQGAAMQMAFFEANSIPGIVYSKSAKKLFITDDQHFAIQQIDPTTGQMLLLAGGSQGTSDGKGSAASFQQPQGIDVDPSSGTLYVSDYDRVRQIATDGTVTTLTAPSSIGPYFQFGQGDEGLAFDTDLRQLYVSDPVNDVIRTVTLTGTVTTLTGQCLPGQFGGCQFLQRDGGLQAALWASPTGIVYNSPDHSIYVADARNNQIRRIQSGTVTTLAGNGQSGGTDGAGIVASLAVPDALIMNPKNTDLYFGQLGGGPIRTVTTQGAPPPPPKHGTFLYDPPSLGSAPAGVTVTPDGSVWFTESGSNKIGQLTTSQTFKEYPLPTGFVQPTRITVGADGNLWFGDATGTYPEFAPSIGRITPSGVVTQFAVPNVGLVNAMTLGQDGNVWFVLQGGGVGLVTPAGVIELFAATPSVGVSYGFDGDLWTVGNSAGVFVARYATDGTQLSDVLYPNEPTPVAIHRGKSNQMWIGQTDALGELKGKTLIEYALPAPCPGCRTRFVNDFAVDAGGAFWLPEGIGYLARFTTAGAITDYIVAAPRARPAGVAIGPDGTIWFADPGADRIGRWF